MIVKKAKINFKKCPLYPLQFDILKIESKKKEISCKRRAERCAFFILGGWFAPGGLRVSSIKKAKPKAKTAAKKSAAKKSSKKTEDSTDLAAVRKDIRVIVEGEAANMAKAVVDEALNGELAPVKYLFEAIGLYPSPAESGPVPQEDSLARTLLRRLGLPEEPMVPVDAAPTRKASRPAEDSEKSTEQESNGDGVESVIAIAIGNGDSEE